MIKKNIQVKCGSCGKIMRQFVEVCPDRVETTVMSIEQYRQGFGMMEHMVYELTSYIFLCECGRIDQVNK